MRPSRVSKLTRPAAPTYRRLYVCSDSSLPPLGPSEHSGDCRHISMLPNTSSRSKSISIPSFIAIPFLYDLVRSGLDAFLFNEARPEKYLAYKFRQ
ncbi:hypothetical protein CHELA20_54183 [Hyphomicrobiales bacterium]|nr:hypothetical protein CHELA41_20742 [Hyphomicrobiales bacterium]CAH1685754.1 hypothetical protein CHELA20_54183 [Hyphomicrobiales bacterium]